MKTTAAALGTILVLATGAPALAHPIQIATLGRAPLLGQSTSPAEMKYNIRHNERLLRTAGYDLGLTTEEYNRFRLAIDVQKPNWVTIPRHLDAMTWSADGQVHVLRDVIIPAGQKGEEVDLNEGGRIVSLFLPARCGNLSVIRRSVPHVAAATIHNFPVPHVAAAPVVAPAETEALVAPAPVVAAVPAAPPIAAAAASHGFALWPLAGLIPFLFANSSSGTAAIVTPLAGTVGGGGGGTIISPPPCPPGTDP